MLICTMRDFCDVDGSLKATVIRLASRHLGHDVGPDEPFPITCLIEQADPELAPDISLPDLLWLASGCRDYDLVWRKYALWVADSISHLAVDERLQHALQVAKTHVADWRHGITGPLAIAEAEAMVAEADLNAVYCRMEWEEHPYDGPVTRTDSIMQTARAIALGRAAAACVAATAVVQAVAASHSSNNNAGRAMARAASNARCALRYTTGCEYYIGYMSNDDNCNTHDAQRAKLLAVCEAGKWVD